MSNAIAYADVKARIEAADLGVPIQWPNEAFSSSDNPSPFLIVEFAGGASVPIELGGEVWQADGQAWVHVLVPINTGVIVAFGLVDAVAEAFRGPLLGPVIYERVNADPGAPGEADGNYWRTSVTCDWKLQTFIPRS